MTCGPILAVDAGTARIGLAVSDEAARFAFPLEVVKAGAALPRIRELIAARGIVRIVVGLPLTLRGEVGPEAERVEKFVARLRRSVAPIEVETVDERLSSSEADRTLEPGRGREHRDAVAASLILSRYLASLRQTSY